ncbi:MAG: short-chain dehydrogenase [Bacteroidota bacterium]|nr:short-chain dehydrogenase [Bacteroidota bacterium]
MNLLEPYNFFFEIPLYTKIKIDSQNRDAFIELMRTIDSVDAYNPELKQQTTYKIIRNPSNTVAQKHQANEYKGIKTYDLQCARNGLDIKIYVNFVVGYIDIYEKEFKECYLIKIGQYPSIADFHISKIKQYDNVLSREKLKEFTKAIGLAANGVGIGSFVYLRRIFESLIEEAHTLAVGDPNWDEALFQKNRMADKIDHLKHHLPEFLVENKALYSILSKGVHELDENECLEYFEAIKVGIELILDEKVEVYTKRKKLEDAKKKIQQIGQQISNK